MARGWQQQAWTVGSVGLVIVAGVGCSAGDSPPPRSFNLYQDWALEPGDRVAGYAVHSGLGDVAINLGGDRIFMPFDGQVQAAAGQEDRCIVISSPEVPAYLFRLCGINRPYLGDRHQGDTLGSGDVVAFAALRRQSDGTWALVEPAKELIAQFLEDP